MTTRARLDLLGECAALFEAWTGPFDADLLATWVAAELGDAEALDRPVHYGPLRSQARPPSRLLHVVSENTPHAAFQSLLRGLVIGASNTLKLPSSGLPELVSAVRELPAALAALVELVHELPANWTRWAQAIIVFGSDETLEWFAANTPPFLRLLPHGQKLSIAVIDGDARAAAPLAARDVSLFDQRGCLSVHDVYLTATAGLSAREFAALLAEEMRRFNQHTPRSSLPPGQAGHLTSLREAIRFAAATAPADLGLWESAGNTDWTVAFESCSRLGVSPLNRFVYVKPWPRENAASALGAERRHLSTIALHPFTPSRAASFLDLGATRICPLGETQSPSLFWHHDGLPALASLVTWIDIG